MTDNDDDLRLARGIRNGIGYGLVMWLALIGAAWLVWATR